MVSVSKWGLHLGCKFAGAGGADCAEWATIPSADKSYFVTQTASSAVKRMCTADRRAKGVNSGISKVSDTSTPCNGPDCSHGHGPLRLVNTNNKFGDMCPIADVYQHCSTARRPPHDTGPTPQPSASSDPSETATDFGLHAGHHSDPREVKHEEPRVCPPSRLRFTLKAGSKPRAVFRMDSTKHNKRACLNTRRVPASSGKLGYGIPPGRVPRVMLRRRAGCAQARRASGREQC